MGKLIHSHHMINIVYQKPPKNNKEAKMEEILYESIFQDYASDIEYAAYSIIALAQIIALRNTVTSFYLGVASQTQSKDVLGSNLWKIILDITINMFLNNMFQSRAVIK